jgi:hypothetical protein
LVFILGISLLLALTPLQATVVATVLDGLQRLLFNRPADQSGPLNPSFAMTSSSAPAP